MSAQEEWARRQIAADDARIRSERMAWKRRKLNSEQSDPSSTWAWVVVAFYTTFLVAMTWFWLTQ